MGGGSSEREISLMTGRAVAGGLRDAGYAVAEVVAGTDDSFELPRGTEAVYVALHGTFGEDGGVQRVLDGMGIPYTGSRAESSRISFDKILTREKFKIFGVRVPEGWVLLSTDSTDFQISKFPNFPIVVKPPRQGSSVGITIAGNEEEFGRGLVEAAKYGDEILVEEFIPGREWTVPILGKRVLPVVEITPKGAGGWYDYTAKYKSGGTTRYTFPEDDPANAVVAGEVRRLALLAFDAVGARSVARVDFRIAPDGAPYALELNSVPGCSETSILPKSAAKAGIRFGEMCAMIMEEAE